MVGLRLAACGSARVTSPWALVRHTCVGRRLTGAVGILSFQDGVGMNGRATHQDVVTLDVRPRLALSASLRPRPAARAGTSLSAGKAREQHLVTEPAGDDQHASSMTWSVRIDSADVTEMRLPRGVFSGVFSGVF
jgi:hypothetical protein